MRRAGLAARALAAWLTDKRGAGWFGEERFAPAWDDRSILMSLGRLFGQAGREGSIGCRSVHVMLHDLVPLDAGQRDLFDVAAVFETRRRWERLSVLRDLLYAMGAMSSAWARPASRRAAMRGRRSPLTGFRRSGIFNAQRLRSGMTYAGRALFGSLMEGR